MTVTIIKSTTKRHRQSHYLDNSILKLMLGFIQPKDTSAIPW